LKDAKAANWVVESFENEPDGFKLLGTSKGYTSFSRAFNHGDKVFYAAHDDDGNREAGWAVYSGGNLTDRHPTATLHQNIYTEGTPAPIAFKGQCTIACTFNQLPFEMLWEHIFDEENPHNVNADQVPQDPANGRGDNVQEALDSLSDSVNKSESDLEEHLEDFENPHGVKAPQVKLDPALDFIGPNEQNVQAAIERLYEGLEEVGDIAGAGLVISTIEPEDPVEGMQWLDSSTAEIWIWDGEKWLEFPAGHDGTSVDIETLPPSDPSIGDMWTDYGTTGELYIWDGRFWVSMTGDGGPKVIVGGGDENPDIELPENLVFDRVEDVDDFDKALARFISSDNTGKWGRIKTGDVQTDPDVTFRDAKGRYRSTKNYEELTDQLKVNRFLASEIERQDEAIEGIEVPPGTVVSEDPPDPAEDGQCWYDTGRLELFVRYEDGWFPCSPLGARVEAGEVLQAQILSRVEAGEAKQATIESSSLKKSGSNTVNSSWRVKSGGKTIISGAEEGKIKIYHLAEPTDGDHAATKSYADGKLSKEGGSLSGILNMQDHYIAGLKTPSSGSDAANKAYVDGNFIGRASYTNVYDDWSVRQQNADGNNRTLLSATGGALGVYNLSEPTDTHHAATKGYVDEKVAGIDIAPPSGPTSKHDGNRLNKSGLSTDALQENDVLFLQGEATVKNIGSIDGIALPEGEFNWDGCAKSGVVRVMNGANLAGYFSVYDMTKNEGRNVILKVKLLKLGDDYTVEYDTGTPCYFHGVFFA
jgi:hypothetical protein